MSNNYLSTVTVIGLPKDTNFAAWLSTFANHADLILDPHEHAKMRAWEIDHDLKSAGLAPLTEEHKQKLVSSYAEDIAWGAIKLIEPWTFEDVSYPRFAIERK